MWQAFLFQPLSIFAQTEVGGCVASEHLISILISVTLSSQPDKLRTPLPLTERGQPNCFCVPFSPPKRPVPLAALPQLSRALYDRSPFTLTYIENSWSMASRLVSTHMNASIGGKRVILNGFDCGLSYEGYNIELALIVVICHATPRAPKMLLSFCTPERPANDVGKEQLHAMHANEQQMLKRQF